MDFLNLVWQKEQDRKINRLARPSPERLLETVRELEARVEKLVLLSMATWSLLEEKTGLSEEDLLKKVQEIDLSDGKLDGRVTPSVARCPKCGRAMAARHDSCLFCGGKKLEVKPFDGVLR